ncbi:MAG: winged helix-turn-helix domain-containing protein [Halobacteriota archaeon]
MEKIELNYLLKGLLNEILEEGTGLRVEEVDAGIFVSPTGIAEYIKSYPYAEDVEENMGMLINVKVREIANELLNRVMIRLQINERMRVLIKSKDVQEAEILNSDLEEGELGEEREKMLEQKTNRIAEAVKASLEWIMRSRVDLKRRNVGMIAEEIRCLLDIKEELNISKVIIKTEALPNICYLALGWLTREDELDFMEREGRYFVRLP